MKRAAVALLLMSISLSAAAESQETVNLLRDKSRSMFLKDFVVVFSCSSTNSQRRYEVTADDAGEATNLAREHMHRGGWCSYNEQFVSANEAR